MGGDPATDAVTVTVRELGQAVVDAVADSFAAGYRAGFWVCSGAMALAAIVAALTSGASRRSP